MGGNYIRWSIRVTHKVSGDSIILTSNHWRTQHKARGAAIKLLRSRAYARKLGIYPSQNVVANYVLPDEGATPNDLQDYRSEA